MTEVATTSRPCRPENQQPFPDDYLPDDYVEGDTFPEALPHGLQVVLQTFRQPHLHPPFA